MYLLVWRRPVPSCFVAALAVAATASAAEVPFPALGEVEGRVRATLEEAHAAVESSPGDAGTWGRYAMILDAHHHPPEAAGAYREAARLDAADSRWPYLLATLLEYQDPAGAIGWYEKAIVLDSSSAASRIRFAQTLEAVGRDTDAASQYQIAADLDPSDYLGPFGLGRIALAEGRLDEAVRHLERAYEIESGVQAVVATLARGYAANGDREGARRKAEEARGLPRTLPHKDPVRAGVDAMAVDLRSYLRRGRTYADVGDLDRARSEVEEALELAPDDAEAWFLAAGIYDRQGAAAEALRAAQRTLDLDPELAGARPVLAGALFKLQRFEEADTVAAEVLEDDPDDVHMRVLSAMGAVQRGVVEEMIVHLDHAYSVRGTEHAMAPVMSQLFVDLAGAFADAGRYDEASERMGQALELAQESGAPPHQLREYRQQLEIYRRAR